ncbi:hypothetical protein ONS95_003244 [Cadophora gregata]|uniref:uncharacterized protein n=1 Tax=Cadophora gregata TaxID=51156 RepID=UPI0026DB0063|nr:uncharacterized protein ONS95_003244 [Cadophora gregata]KAK0108441.1 hypothetical protein ONS95_003244 [Cadophora gregata]
MARVTRSRKFVIAEDDTALASQTPLPITPAKQPGALLEADILMATNTITTTMDDDAAAAEVKGLKAAYKSALGAGKKLKRSTRGNKRKDKQNDSEATLVEEQGSGDLALVSPVLQTDTPLLPSCKEIAPSSENPQIMAPQPATRNTRHQSAKAQAGQYSYNLSDLVGSRDCSVVSQKLRDIDFITLFGGTGLNRTRKCSASSRDLSYGYKTNAIVSLAKEVWSRSHHGINNDATDGTGFDSTANADTIRESTAQKSKSSHTPAGSPAKTLEEVEIMYGTVEEAVQNDEAGDDSFVQQITCRSPAKPVSRIEDSVEALDQLEEALEALNQATLAERMVSPEKSRQKARMPYGFLEGHKMGKQASVKVIEKQAPVKTQPSKTGYATVRVKSAPKQTPTLKKAASMNFKPATSNPRSATDQAKVQATAKATVKRPISLLPPKETIKSTKPPTRSTFELPGEAVAAKLKEQREARLAQRQSSEESFHTALRAVSGPKIKSNKPPTKPTFELPGEELSRRKKAAHEARLKAQEEEERKRREFKARPVRNSVAPNMVPRETVASRARQSKVGIDSFEDGKLSVSKRGSNVGAHRPSMAALNLANMSAPRAKGAFIPPVRKPSPNMSGVAAAPRPVQRAVSVTDSDLRKRAKEIYNRDARLTEEMDKEKRDREAAAKRAREEAAERGRQASREWAERQMAKKMAEGDRGMNAGYGPGGQMGLSHN